MNKSEEDDLEAFLYEVDAVNKEVKDLVSGKIDIDKIKEKEENIKKRRELAEEEKRNKEQKLKRMEEERLIKGKKGKGIKDTYIRFCRGCFTEYEIDIETCTHCGTETITKDVKSA